MRDLIHDVLNSFKYSLFVFPASFMLGLIIGLIKHGFDFMQVLAFGIKTPQIISIIGFAIAGMSFISRDTLRPLDYEDEWRKYFKKFNLAFAIFFIFFFNVIIAYVLEYILFFKIL